MHFVKGNTLPGGTRLDVYFQKGKRRVTGKQEAQRPYQAWKQASKHHDFKSFSHDFMATIIIFHLHHLHQRQRL